MGLLMSMSNGMFMFTGLPREFLTLYYYSDCSYTVTVRILPEY